MTGGNSKLPFEDITLEVVDRNETHAEVLKQARKILRHKAKLMKRYGQSFDHEPYPFRKPRFRKTIKLVEEIDGQLQRGEMTPYVALTTLTHQENMKEISFLYNMAGLHKWGD